MSGRQFNVFLINVLQTDHFEFISSAEPVGMSMVAC